MNDKTTTRLYMLKALITAGVLTAFAFSASASTVAIIDSGTDMEHQDIAPKAWTNPDDIPDNQRDEDGNGYPDDVYGWNFAESNNEVIDYSYLGLLNDRVRKFFSIQTKAMLGTASQEEVQWLRSQLEDKEFVKRLQTYGNFMHGTHVAGIAAEGAREAQIMAVKLIPTEVKLPGQEDAGEKGIGTWLVKKGLKALAKQQAKTLVEIGDYVGKHSIDVANGSFGTGYAQASTIVKAIFENILQREPTEEELKETATYFIDSLVENVKEMATISQDTLFVFAAGNDGTDNDEFPTSPSNIQAQNVISVAATLGRRELASFSNYGKRMVDVAAPGVAVESAVPGGNYLKVSGTSQAAPYVANVAAKLKDTNSSLTPKQTKDIIMGTVDAKDFLKDKVKTAGIVNEKRALVAARLVEGGTDVHSAIEEASEMVDDLPAQNKKGFSPREDLPKGIVQPLPSLFKIQK